MLKNWIQWNNLVFLFVVDTGSHHYFKEFSYFLFSKFDFSSTYRNKNTTETDYWKNVRDVHLHVNSKTFVFHQVALSTNVTFQSKAQVFLTFQTNKIILVHE